MEISKQLFEDVLSGKLKGKFVFRNAHSIYGAELKPNHTCVQKPKSGFYIIRMPHLLFNVVDSDGKSVYCCVKHKEETENNPNFDVVNFIPTTNMKENELAIEIPERKIVDWDESKKQNKIVLRDKQLTYEEMCDKLFPKSGTYYYVNNHGNISTASSMCNPYISNPNSATTAHQLECILAKNKLANVAKYLNDGWKPSKGDIVFILTFHGNFENSLVIGKFYFGNGENQIIFKTQELAQQAIEILGEETIKLALEPLGI